jgi:hypothetical protein
VHTLTVVTLTSLLQHSDMLTLTTLTIELRWEQAGSGGSGFAGRGETGFVGSGGYAFAGSRESGFAMSWLEALDLASLSQL